MDASTGRRLFGRLLEEKRKKAAQTNPELIQQKNAADLISKILNARGLERGGSRSSLSQYESGAGIPNADTLDVIATLYNTDRLELLYPLFFSEYADYLPNGFREEQARAFWEYLKAGASILSRSELGCVDQLRALSAFVVDHQVLDRRGQIAWQQSLLNASPKLECFWVAQGDFLDDADFYEVALHNIKSGALYVYFLREQGTTSQRFEAYKRRLLADIGAKSVQDRIVQVPFGRDEDMVTLDFVVANPHLIDDGEAIGFCRIHNDFVYNIKLSRDMVRDRVKRLALYVINRDRPQFHPTQILPAIKPRDLSQKKKKK